MRSYDEFVKIADDNFDDISSIKVDPNTKGYQIGNETYDANEQGRLVKRSSSEKRLVRPSKPTPAALKKNYDEQYSDENSHIGPYGENI